MTSLRVLFAGTPDFAVPTLESLIQSPHELVAVLTQPDRKAGRGRGLRASPVKQRAQQAEVPVMQPASLRDEQARAELARLRADLMVVIAYGLILPVEILELPRYGCWNLHASLLPRWRGAAPIQRAIEAGDRETGVCLMQMEAGLDTGPVIACRKTAISDKETGGSLHDRLARLSADLLPEWLERLATGKRITATPQDQTRACYAPKLDKKEGDLDLRRPATELARKVRAFNPWPVARLSIAGDPVRVWRAQPVRWPGQTSPGEVVAAGAEGIDLATGENLLRILELQRAGGRRISAADYLNARQDLRQ